MGIHTPTVFDLTDSIKYQPVVLVSLILLDNRSILLAESIYAPDTHSGYSRCRVDFINHVPLCQEVSLNKLIVTAHFAVEPQPLLKLLGQALQTQSTYTAHETVFTSKQEQKCELHKLTRQMWQCRIYSCHIKIKNNDEADDVIMHALLNISV